MAWSFTGDLMVSYLFLALCPLFGCLYVLHGFGFGKSESWSSEWKKIGQEGGKAQWLVASQIASNTGLV
jgi:hypothetical protein